MLEKDKTINIIRQLERQILHLNSLPIDEVEAIIISEYENYQQDPKERKDKIENLLAYRCHRLIDEFEWTPENIKALEEANEMLISECLATAQHLKEHVDVIERNKPLEETEYTDYEAYVEVYDFKSEPTDEDDYESYYKTTHIEDVLTSDANRWYDNQKVLELWYKIDDGTRSKYYGLEKGWVLWLDEEKETDNWNEGLPEEYTKDMHLCYAFHNLLDHCHFAPQDIINIKSLHHILIIRT